MERSCNAHMKSLELFVGAGGLALGAARAGFDHAAVIDWNGNACKTLRRNKADGVDHVRDWEIIDCDVRKHDFRSYAGKVEVVIGGPPCQPFSIGGKHHGYRDEHDMSPQAVHVVRTIRQKGAQGT
jgi:DNA (cytosine-5)-methyltransferase 1